MSDPAPVLDTAFETSGASDVGTVRTENQDAWQVVPLAGGGVGLIVADGMGGHAGGGEAAVGTVAAVAAVLREARADAAADVTIARAASAASDAVAELRSRMGANPGTTLVLALLRADGSFSVGNIGDSRAYLVRPAAAEPLTDDHSWVGEQVRQGLLAPDAARHHPRRNIITRAVMGSGERADVTDGTVADDDVLLLCSDGVWEPLADEALPQLCASEPFADVAARVNEAALRAGSRDNVTTLVARRRRGAPA